MLESVVNWTNTSFPLTMNDQSKRSLTVSPYYWFRLTNVDGLWDADIRREEHPLPGAHGVVSGDQFYGAKALTLTGEIRAKGLTNMRLAQRAMEAAFWDMKPYQLQFTLWGESAVYLTCRKHQPIVMGEEQTEALSAGLAYKRKFVLSLKADDPRFYLQGGTTVFNVFESG